ncbi:MAG: Cytochrome peroxidase [Planctomycetaceae bacterium]|nr:Cytochrome peroxidase [Planctomycetaceae bacterium]
MLLKLLKIRFLICVGVIAVASLLVIRRSAGVEDRAPAPRDSSQEVRNRRPLDAIFFDAGKTLCVANQRSGSLSFVDLSAGRVIHELQVGNSLTSLAALPVAGQAVVVDAGHEELIRFTWQDGQARVVWRLKISPGSVTVAVTPNGRYATVAALWSHCVDVFDLESIHPDAVPAVSAENVNSADRLLIHSKPWRRIEIPFPPRLQSIAQDGRRVVVADGFGGHLALVDLLSGQIVGTRLIDGHNIRGLGRDPLTGQTLLTYQVLNQRLLTSQDNIERGLLMQNVLSSLDVDSFSPRADSVRNSELSEVPILSLPRQELGRKGDGAGDPAGIAVLDHACLAIALSGVNELAVMKSPNHGNPAIHRILVGRRPTVVVRKPGTKMVAVLNSLDDSISLVDTDRFSVHATISLGTKGPSVAQDRGERLFFDAKISRDGWLSCHSCHPDGHTNGLLADTLGDKSSGTPKRILTLLGTALTYRWAWNGEVANLHEQVQKSQIETMHGEKIGAEAVRDLVAFLHTLPAPPPVAPLPHDATDAMSLQRGQHLFETLKCQLCHIPPLVYSSHESYDVGLRDEQGQTKFNPPSLRGVSQGWRFFHDNRARSLESVFSDFHHPGGTELDQNDLRDLVRFLKSI